VTRFVLAGLRNRPWRAALLGVGILASAVSFVLLTGTAKTSSIQIHGTLTHNFRAAYDILVRPRTSYTPLEHEQALVRDNYLAGIYGGITLRQYQRIRRIPGVQIAAPIANVGTSLVRSVVFVPLGRFEGDARDEVFRIHFTWRSQAGLSSYPAADVYAYVTHRRFVPSTFGFDGVGVVDPVTQRIDPVCDGWHTPAVMAPFVPANSSYLSACASTDLAPAIAARKQGNAPIGTKLFGARYAAAVFEFVIPVNVAAIDPTAEAKLVGLRRALVAGRYLGPQTHERVVAEPDMRILRIPALESTRTFVDEQLAASVERVVVPAGADVPGLLAAGACPGTNQGCPARQRFAGPPGKRNATAYGFFNRLPSVPVGSRTFSAAQTYTRSLSGPGRGIFGRPNVVVDTYWTGEPVRYRRVALDELAPTPVVNPPETWFSGIFGSDSGYVDQPTDNLDVQFRSLTEAHSFGYAQSLGNELPPPQLHPVGLFDPKKLPGFSPLSRVPLETYYPPSLEPADARTSHLLHGRPLGPTQNIGDYVQQPPLLLTSLSALPALFSSTRFTHASPRQQRAPISVIRVRVAGVRGPDQLSQQRIKTVAQLIHDRTGLSVDVTAGSSPTPITIDLAKGKYGRPPLKLTEGWVKKNVAVTYLNALDRKDLALFAVVLLVCCFFLANGTLASVRARRTEIGTLRTFGWSPRAVFAVILGELAVVGAVAGTAGAVVAAVVVRVFALDFSLVRVLLVAPLAIVLALASGVLPALEASRGQPLDAVRPAVAPGRRAHGRSVASLAIINVARLPLRTAIAAGALAVGVASLTILVAIERSFHGVLVGTLLGNAVSIQVRAADIAAAAIIMSLAALAVADVLYLNLRERAAEIATLRATGWARRHVARLVSLEALAIGMLGAAAGLVVGVAVGRFVLGVPVSPLVVGALVASAIGLAAALVAAAVPTAQALAGEPARVLAAE
jgi:hypothetical protein